MLYSLKFSCQHQHGSPLAVALRIFIFAAIFCLIQQPQNVRGQIGYTRHLSELDIAELKSIATRLEYSINPEKYACDSYYDYVCSRNRPIFSVLGNQPESSELIQLSTELQNEPEQFEAKRKMVDFFVSCNTQKSIDDCYLETFVYFKPLFGYIITKKHIDVSAHEHRNFLEILKKFLDKAENTENFQRNPIRLKLISLMDKFRNPQMYFRSGDLDQEYADLKIYRESYKHNLRNLELYRKRNSTYEMGVQRTMLDWSLFVFQSRHKPMSYYFPTLNVHLWMTLFNNTAREIQRDPKRFAQMVECLKLPQFVNVIDEAVIMAVVYLKSFQNAWQDFREWIMYTGANQEKFDQENHILKAYHLDNKRLFFTLYAQNFCDFGKELAENVFFLGLRQNQDFFSVYSCGYQTERMADCI